MTEVDKPCDHDTEWIGEPYGFIPTHWRCAKCQTRITAGEMLILTQVRRLIAASQND